MLLGRVIAILVLAITKFFVNTGISVRQSPLAAKQTIPKGLFLVINSTMAQLPVVAQM